MPVPTLLVFLFGAVVIGVLPFVTCWLERQALSPHALIGRTLRARHVPVEHVERVVAVESARLLSRADVDAA